MPWLLRGGQPRQVAAELRGSAQVSDAIDLRVVPVPDSQAEDLYRGVVPLQAQQALLWRRAAKRGRWLAYGALAVGFAEAIAITALLPLEKIIPVFVYLDKFGAAQATAALSELPADHRIAGIDA